MTIETGYAIFMAGAGIGMLFVGIGVAVRLLVGAYKELSGLCVTVVGFSCLW